LISFTFLSSYFYSFIALLILAFAASSFSFVQTSANFGKFNFYPKLIRSYERFVLFYLFDCAPLLLNFPIGVKLRLLPEPFLSFGFTNKTFGLERTPDASLNFKLRTLLFLYISSNFEIRILNWLDWRSSTGCWC